MRAFGMLALVLCRREAALVNISGVMCGYAET